MHPEAFKKAVAQSLFAHFILLLVALIGLPEIFLAEDQKPMDVIMVDITRGTSDELGESPPEVKHLPDNTIEEQKNPMPTATDTRTTAPRVVEVVKTPPAVDPRAMKDPEKTVKTQPRGMNAADAAALAKINDTLKQHKITDQAANTTGAEGYKYGNTNKPTNIMNSPELIRYRAMVKDKITRERLNLGDDRSIKPPAININISGSGAITSKSFARRSGNASVDAAAMRAVERASPLPVPPESIRAFVSTHGFTIGF